MRRRIITQNMTVDGAVEVLDDWFAPQAQADHPDLTEENRRQDEDADALLLGRRTIGDFRGHWRDLSGDDATDHDRTVADQTASGPRKDQQWT